MRRPYLYLALQWNAIDLHFVAAPGLDATQEAGGTCLVMVDDVTPYHRAFSADPSGNTIIVIQRDEPVDVEYGGSPTLEGLARVIDSARILRDFKTDLRAAARVLDAGLRRHADAAPTLDRARALAARAELAHGTPPRHQ